MAAVLCAALALVTRAEAQPVVAWRPVVAGVEVAELDAPLKSRHSDSRFVVTRVDARKAEVVLLSARGAEAYPTAPGWADARGLAVVTNAGMFDLETHRPVGYAKDGGRALNPRWRKDYRAVLVADPSDPSLPAVQLLDRECDDVDALLPKYRVALQGIRMVSCKGRNTWQKDAKEWSVAVAAVDGKGRLLFIHSRSPYTMNAFIEHVKALPLDVRRMVYLEGGPEASLVVGSGADRVVRFGSYETGFNENDDNDVPWALPNVLGVRAGAAPR